MLSSSQPDLTLLDHLTLAQGLCLSAVTCVCSAVFGAWLLPGIASLLPAGWSIMQASTALCMLLSVASLSLSQPGRSNRELILSRIFATVVLGIIAAALCQHVSGWPIGLHSLFPADAAAVMSLQSATFLALLGLTLMFMRVRKSILATMVDTVTLGLVILVMLVLAGYGFGATHLFAQSESVRTSPQTLICMLLLAFVAVGRRAEYGYFSVLIGVGIGSQVARLLLPFAVVLPFLLVLAGDYSEVVGWMSASYASALSAVTMSVLFVCLMIVVAWRINGLERELRDMTLTDELTRTFNRRGFQLLGEQALREARRVGTQISVLYFDLDALKVVNDTFGHETGSQFLVDVARLLRKNFRGVDVVARVGGDEFAVVTRNGVDAAYVAVERMAVEVASINASGEKPYTVSYSVGGTSSRPAGDELFEDLVARADALMYEQKREKKLAGQN